MKVKRASAILGVGLFVISLPCLGDIPSRCLKNKVHGLLMNEKATDSGREYHLAEDSYPFSNPHGNFVAEVGKNVDFTLASKPGIRMIGQVERVYLNDRGEMVSVRLLVPKAAVNGGGLESRIFTPDRITSWSTTGLAKKRMDLLLAERPSPHSEATVVIRQPNETQYLENVAKKEANENFSARLKAERAQIPAEMAIDARQLDMAWRDSLSEIQKKAFLENLRIQDKKMARFLGLKDPAQTTALQAAFAEKPTPDFLVAPFTIETLPGKTLTMTRRQDSRNGWWYEATYKEIKPGNKFAVFPITEPKNLNALLPGLLAVSKKMGASGFRLGASPSNIFRSDPMAVYFESLEAAQNYARAISHYLAAEKKGSSTVPEGMGTAAPSVGIGIESLTHSPADHAPHLKMVEEAKIRAELKCKGVTKCICEEFARIGLNSETLRPLPAGQFSCQ